MRDGQYHSWEFVVDGEPVAERQDLDIDWIEVLQKTSRLDTAPAPFATRPRLEGTAAVGGSITCRAELPGIRDVRRQRQHRHCPGRGRHRDPLHGQGPLQIAAAP